MNVSLPSVLNCDEQSLCNCTGHQDDVIVDVKMSDTKIACEKSVMVLFKAFCKLSTCKIG